MISPARLPNFLAVLLAACGAGGSRGPFDRLQVVATPIGPLDVDSWIADTPEARGEGLMNATERDLAPAPDGAER